MSDAPTTPAVAPGYTLFPLDDRWVVRMPGGDLVALRRDVMSGVRTVADLASPANASTVDTLRAAQVLDDEITVSQRSRRSRSARVVLVGPDPITVPMAQVLTDSDHRVATAAPDLDRYDAGADAVVWCGPVPAMVACQLDERCLAGDIIWQRCGLEGGRAVLEPLGHGGAPVTHAMTRARRLAAAEHPDALRGSWSPRALRGATLLTAAAGMLLAALMAQDLLAVLDPDRGPERPDSARILRTVDLRTLQIAAHPILPVPRCTWREPEDD